MLFIWSSVPYRTNKVDAGHTVSAARSNITVNDLNEKRVRLFLKEHSFKSDLQCYHTQGTGYVSSQVISIFCSMLLNKSFSIQSGCPLIGWGTWLRKDQPDSWRKQTEGSCPTFASVFGLNTLQYRIWITNIQWYTIVQHVVKDFKWQSTSHIHM